MTDWGFECPEAPRSFAGIALSLPSRLTLPLASAELMKLPSLIILRQRKDLLLPSSVGPRASLKTLSPPPPIHQVSA